MRTYERPEGLPPKSRHYFTQDGTYGTATEIKVIDTTRWTEQQWREVEDASDSERYYVAVMIDKEWEMSDLDTMLGKKGN